MDQRTKKNFEWSFVFLIIASFLIFKMANLSFRFGDGNVYFYMAKVFLEGSMPYRDFFSAVPPFLIIFLAFLRFFAGDYLIFYQAVPVFLEVGTALLLFLFLKKENNFFALLAPIFYLFSFTIISTSDYFTGVQLVTFLMVLALYAWQNNKPFLSGVFWAFSFLTKFYALPAFFGFLIFVFLFRRDFILKIIAGAATVVVLILGPFILISPIETFNNLLVHHLNRPRGLSKSDVLKFFAAHEWFFIISASAGMIANRKKISLLLPFFFTFIFLVFFRDLYYTYLAILMPFIVIFTIWGIKWLWQRVSSLKDNILMPLMFGVSAIFLILSFNNYLQTIFVNGRLLNAQKIADFIKIQPDNFQIYGSHEIAPLIALMSERPLFDNQIETNTQAFASGALNLKGISEKAVQSGIYLISRIYDYPQYNINNVGFEGFFDRSLFDRYCQELKKFISTSGESDNYIKIFKCYKY